VKFNVFDSTFSLQNVDEPWPLTLIDLTGKKQKIFLNPGEMVLYESAKVPHGRQSPFNGTFYDNLFVHFYPL
jgi:prolyl 4-hydroxylase